jgi:ribonuclease HII
MAANDDYEKALWASGCKYVCGVDETACGSLVGVVNMACVIFPASIDYKALLPGLNDSKQLTAEKREALYPLIKQHALDWAVAEASVEEIDQYNIFWAKWMAAKRALAKLKVKPDHILMDGNKVIPEVDTPQTAIVKGDAKSISIGAASILAKVDRDRYIVELAKNVHADFGWAENKGYYTEGHIAALKKYGKTEWHRSKYVSKFIGGW